MKGEDSRGVEYCAMQRCTVHKFVCLKYRDQPTGRTHEEVVCILYYYQSSSTNTPVLCIVCILGVCVQYAMHIVLTTLVQERTQHLRVPNNAPLRKSTVNGGASTAVLSTWIHHVMCIVCIAVEREQLPSTRQTYDIDTPEYDMHNYAYSNSRSTSQQQYYYQLLDSTRVVFIDRSKFSKGQLTLSLKFLN